MEHTPTPWYYDGDGVYSNEDCEGAPLAHVLSMGYDNDFRNIDARRIVACVNACAGLDTEQLESSGGIAATAKYLSVQIASVNRQRDHLQQQLATERASLFAESQRKQQLEDQVAELVGVLERIADTDPDDGTAWFHDIARAAIQKVRGGNEATAA